MIKSAEFSNLQQSSALIPKTQTVEGEKNTD